MLEGVPLDVNGAARISSWCEHAAAAWAVACRAGAEARKPFMVYRTAGIGFMELVLPGSSAGVVPLGHLKLDTLYQPTTTHSSLHILDIWVSSALSVIANALRPSSCQK